MNALSANDPLTSGIRTPLIAEPVAAISTPAAPSGHSRRPALIILGAALVVGLAALWYFQSSSGRESTDSAFVDGHRVALAAQVSGRVSEVLVDDNQLVNAGEVVLRIDPADYQVKLDQAEAAKAQAESALAHARAQLPVIQAIARQAAVQVKVAEANAHKTADDLHRYRELSENAVSRLVLDAAATQETVSSAQVDAAREGAAAAAGQIALGETAITAAEATVRAASSQVAQAHLALSYCELKAPVTGYVTRKSVERGNFIQMGQPVLNLVTKDLYVIANFKETQLTHLSPGQPVDITVDTFPGLTFKGRVGSLMSGTGSAFALLPPENATGNFVKVVQRVPVKIVFDREELSHLPKLALGLSVIATVNMNQTPASRTETSAIR
ncbi:MAG: HlyD family secretion protein [Lacunisphaera sp.]